MNSHEDNHMSPVDQSDQNLGTGQEPTLTKNEEQNKPKPWCFPIEAEFGGGEGGLPPIHILLLLLPGMFLLLLLLLPLSLPVGLLRWACGLPSDRPLVAIPEGMSIISAMSISIAILGAGGTWFFFRSNLSPIWKQLLFEMGWLSVGIWVVLSVVVSFWLLWRD